MKADACLVKAVSEGWKVLLAVLRREGKGGLEATAKQKWAIKGFKRKMCNLHVTQLREASGRTKDDGNVGEANDLWHRSQQTPSRQDFPSRG